MVTFRVNIAVNTKGATAATSKVQKSLKGVKTQADTARVSIGRMFSVLLAFTAIRRTVRLIADFEQALSTIQAVTNATAADMAKLTAEAERLGITTRFSATEAADGMVLLSRAGFTVQETMSAVGDTLRLAQAGGLSLARATEIAADTLRAFNIEAENTVRVVDVLAKASNSSNTTVNQLGQALKFVAPIAKGLNVSLEETSSALANLANSGQKASIGGTGLRRVMAALESPTAKAQRTLATLGLNADDVRISSVGLTGALENLAAAGITTTEVFQVFGRRSGTAAAVLLANVDKVAALTVSLQNAAGTAESMAKIMDDNLNGAIFRATSAMKGFGIAIGRSGLSNDLTLVLEGAASGFRGLAEVAGILTIALEGIGIIVIASLIPAVIKLTAKMGLLNKAVALNPFVLLGATIATVALQTVSAIQDTEAAIEAAGNAIKQDRSFGVAGRRLEEYRNQITRLNEEQRKGNISAQDAASTIKVIQVEIDTITKKLVLWGDAIKKTAAARAQAQPSVKNALASLKRQSEALLDVTQAQKDEAAALKQVLELRKQKVQVDANEEKTIKAAVKALLADKRRAAILNQLNGALQTATQKQKDLNDMLKSGAINAGQFNSLMAEVKATLDGLETKDPFQKMLASLQATNNELTLQAHLSGVDLTIGQAILELSSKKIKLTAEQRVQLEALIRANDALNDRIDKRNKLEAAPATKSQAELMTIRRAALLKEISLTTQLAQRRRDLIALAQDPANLQYLADINASLAAIDAQALQSSTSLEDGFTRAFQAIHAEAQDFASVAEASVNAVANSVSNTLAKALIDGAFTWKDFTKSILDDITRIITRLLVMQAISAALGGAGTAPGLPGVNPSEPLFRAAGGAVQPDRSFIVGENGPELFTPRAAGNITPAGSTAGATQAAPQINMQVVNVDDPEMVPQSIADGSSDEAIINVISRNRDKLKGIL